VVNSRVQPAKAGAVGNPGVNRLGFGVGELGQAEQDQDQHEAVAQDRGSEEIEGSGTQADAVGGRGTFEGADHGRPPCSSSQ
jgi:hypothetical protein